MKTPSNEKYYISASALEKIYTHEELIFNPSPSEEFFSIFMIDNSMSPRILEGDTLIVRNQSTVENGEVALILINEENLIVRKIHKNSSGIAFSSFNPDVAKITYTYDQIDKTSIRILGRIVECRTCLINGVL